MLKAPRRAQILRYVPSGSLALAGLIGLVADIVPAIVRVMIAGVLLIGALAAFFLNKRRSNQWNSLYVDRAELESALVDHGQKVVQAAPAFHLPTLAEKLLTGEGAGRLSLYEIYERGDELVAAGFLRYSSNRIYEDFGRIAFPIHNSYLRDIISAPLVGAAEMHWNESGQFPDPEVDLDAWSAMQSEVLGDLTTARRLRMRARKYAWVAMAGTGSKRRALALMVESTHPDGINTAALRDSLVHVVFRQLVDDIESVKLVSKLEDEILQRFSS